MAKKRKLRGRKNQRKLRLSSVYNNRNFADDEDERLRRIDMQIRLQIPDRVKREMYIRELLAKIEANIKEHEEAKKDASTETA